MDQSSSRFRLTRPVISAGVAWIAWFVAFATLIYYPFNFGVWQALLAFILSGVAAISGIRRTSHHVASPKERSVSLSAWMPMIGYAAVLIVIVMCLLQGRTAQAILSPWNVVSPVIFILYAVAALYWLLLAWHARSAAAFIALTIPFLFVTCGVYALVYALGFGFDPFVHQAAERAIFEHGAAWPKTPYYVGHYVLVLGLHLLSHLRISVIDAWVVPVLASLLLPVGAWVFGKGSARMATMVLAFLILLASAFFGFSVPYNLAGLFGILAVLFALGGNVSTTVALSAAALCVHPLIGIPLALCAIGSAIAQRRFYIGAFIAACAGPVLCAAIGAFAFRGGGAVAWGTVSVLDAAHILFAPPFLFWKAVWHFFFAYGISYAVRVAVWVSIPLILALGWRKRDASLIPAVAGASLICAAFILTLTVRFNNIIAYEQFEFPLRLVAAAGWLGAIAAVPVLVRLIERLPRAVLFVVVPLFAAMLAGTWYASAPQANAFVVTSGASISAIDVRTIREIDDMAAARPYAAFTPQMVSAAALVVHGFDRSIQTPFGAHYPYAIPTGDELYAHYLGLWTAPDPRDWLMVACELTGNAPVFIVLPNEWDTDGEIASRFKPVTQERRVVEDRVVLEMKECFLVE